MTWLTEDPWPIIWISLALLAALAVGYYNSQNRLVLAAIVVVLLLAGTALVVEQLVVTEREEIELTLDAAAAAVKQNNLQRVLTYIDPDALAMRTSVQAILPTFDVVDAKVTGNLKTEIRHAGSETTATASFIGKISVRNEGNQLPLPDNFVRPFTVQLRKINGRWLMTGYETDRIPQR